MGRNYGVHHYLARMHCNAASQGAPSLGNESLLGLNQKLLTRGLPGVLGNGLHRQCLCQGDLPALVTRKGGFEPGGNTGAHFHHFWNAGFL